MFNQYFGNYLLEKKILSPEELRPVLEEQKTVKVKLGVLAIDFGYLNAPQVDRIHKLQAAEDKKFGELAVEEGYLTRKQVEELLQTQKQSNLLLGQVLIEKGIFTFEKYEEVLRQYRQDAGLSPAEIQALKNNDVEKIAAIFLKTLPAAENKLIRDYFELFIRNIIRFIDGEIRVEAAREAEVYGFDYLATQRLEGEYHLFSGFAAPENVMARFASIYAQEELAEMNGFAKDALSEFLNCHNGLFLSHLSAQGIESDLFLAEVKTNGRLEPVEKLYVIPCHLSFGRIDFLFASELPYFA